MDYAGIADACNELLEWYLIHTSQLKQPLEHETNLGHDSSIPANDSALYDSNIRVSSFLASRHGLAFHLSQLIDLHICIDRSFFLWRRSRETVGEFDHESLPVLLLNHALYDGIRVILIRVLCATISRLASNVERRMCQASESMANSKGKIVV